MKKYIDIDEVISIAEVPKSLWKYEDLMKEKPNYDKSDNRGKLDEGRTKERRTKKKV